MRKIIISNLFLFAFLVVKTAWATDAWSIVSDACTIWTVGGKVDNATHFGDTSPAYGLYTTVKPSSTNSGAILFCPVWLPHGSYISALKFRYYDALSSPNSEISVALYKQRSLYGTTTPAEGDYVQLVSPITCKSVEKSAPEIQTCSFAREKVCNYNDGIAPCNDDRNIFLYFAIVQIKGNTEEPLPKIYNIWVGELPISSYNSYENYTEPVDCGWVMEKYNEGLEIAEEEKGCFLLYGMSI